MPDQKDFWDKLDIVLKPTGGILAALAVASIGYFGSNYLKQKEQLDANSRALAQIVSQREDADSTLRMDMFKSIIEKFFNNPDDRDQQVLSLELLAYNFHESLDLAPLFQHLNDVLRNDLKKARGNSGGVDASDPSVIEGYMARLKRVAQEVVFKQVTALTEGENSAQGTVFFDELDKKPEGITVIDKQKVGDRWFSLEVLKRFPQEKELRVKLTSYTRTAGETPDAPPSWSITDAIFQVGFFDFPMIDNSRLSNGRRAAVVLTEWDDQNQRSAQVRLVNFPGERASLREKQYYDELLKKLLPQEEIDHAPSTAEAGGEP